ncbi:hypothetical protein HDU87_008613 [Geranomyces variabilis]|uniref:GH26 domain-containing protein n=1 Tax=Geranomyces variabilis TaxID=109894 RepID=A0AAD5XSK9_9FUNG|nr:hypothetical protein HDU87_008613 [Geranomyces variabilis]
MSTLVPPPSPSAPLPEPAPNSDPPPDGQGPSVDDHGQFKPIPWRKTNMNSAWTVLTDDHTFGTAQEWPGDRSIEPNSDGSPYALQLVNPPNGRGYRRIAPTSPRQKKSRHSMRNRCLIITFALLTAAVVTFMVAFFTVKSKERTTFDPAAGPRGQLPAPPPGPPLPVLNMLGNASLPVNGSSANVYFGASIDWSQEDPQSFNRALGRNAAIIDGYFMISDTLERANNVNSSGISHQIPDYYNWTAGLVGGTGAIMGITVMPYKGLGNVSVQAMLQLGEKCREINAFGVPILLRFAPEMNGNWYPWGQSPSQYIAVFRQLAQIVRNATTPASAVNSTTGTSADSNVTLARTAMVWAPAVGNGYPLYQVANASATPGFNATTWLQMDTNSDDVVDDLDDPYSPFYPGDEYVDWIGITALYNTTLSRNATEATALGKSQTLVPAIANVTFHSGPLFGAGSGAGSESASTVPSTTTISTSSAPTSLPTGVSFNATYNRIPSSGRNEQGSFESIVAARKFSVYNFAKKRSKPLVVGETGIGYLSGPGIAPTPDELAVKSAWWNQVYNATLLKKYPLIRAIVWYDYALPLAGLPSSYVLDYSISRTPSISAAFRNATQALPDGTLVFANETLSADTRAAANSTALGLTQGPAANGTRPAVQTVVISTTTTIATTPPGVGLSPRRKKPA